MPRASAMALLSCALVLVAGVLPIAILRPLEPAEATLLLAAQEREVTGLAAPDPLLVRVQSAWGMVVGHMERPARWLSVLAVLLGSLGLLLLIDRDHGARVTIGAGLALAASPAFWEESSTIGSWGLAFTLAVGLMGLARTIPRAGRSLPIPLGFLFAALAPTLAGLLGADSGASGRADALASLAPVGLGPDDAPIAIGVAAGIVILAVCYAGSRWNPWHALLFVGAVATIVRPELVGLPEGPVGPGALALLAPMSAMLGGAVGKPSEGSRAPARVVLGALMVMSVIGIASAVWSSVDTPDAPNRADRLEWVYRHVGPAAWVLLAGDHRAVDRYYTLAGHRTGHATIMVGDATAADDARRRALFYKPPYLVLLDAGEEALATLRDIPYREEPVEGLPDGVLVLRYRP